MVKTLYGELAIEGENLLINYSKLGAMSAMVPSKILHLPSLVAFEFKPSAHFQDGLLLFQSDRGRTDIHFSKKQEKEVVLLSMAIEKIALKALGNKVSGPHDYPSITIVVEEHFTNSTNSDISDAEAYLENARQSNPKPEPVSFKFSDLKFPKKISEFKSLELWSDSLRQSRDRFEVIGATADVEMGASKERITATRVGLGALIAGPVGALVGANSKKSQTKGYLSIITNNVSILVEFQAKEQSAARRFASDVTDAAMKASKAN